MCWLKILMLPWMISKNTGNAAAVGHHTFLWLVAESNQLSTIARGAIEDPNHEYYIHIAPLYEISIKTALGKLTIHGR